MSSGGGGDARRPARPALTRDYILHAALKIIDRSGINGLSMRRLGTELGVDPMAVYHYLPSKAALFDGIVELVYAEIDLDVDGLTAAETWRRQVTEYMYRLRAVMRRHPHVLPIIATRPAYPPALLQLGDRSIAAIRQVGFTGREALQMVNCLRSFTIGHVFAEVGEPVGGPTPTVADATAMIVESYPNLAGAIAGGYQPDEQYELGLQALLDGFEQRLSHPS